MICRNSRELVDLLALMPETVAVVLGGSRTLGSADAGSDWDLGLSRSLHVGAVTSSDTWSAPASRTQIEQPCASLAQRLLADVGAIELDESRIASLPSGNIPMYQGALVSGQA